MSDRFDQFHRNLEESIRRRIHVGIKDNPEFATRLARNEYGVGVPERSAIRDFLRVERRRGLKRGLAHVLEVGVDFGGVSEKAQATLGEVVAGKVRQAIRQYDAVPNDPDTVDEKGRNDPLEDTGATVDAIESWLAEEGT